MRDSQLYCRRGSVQLWQFLLALLEDGLNGAIIVWTGKGLEFKLIEPEEVKDTSPVERRSFMSVFSLGGTVVGCAEESSDDELRQTLSFTSVLLREGHHAEGGRRTLCLPICL